jgi:Fic family protein
MKSLSQKFLKTILLDQSHAAQIQSLGEHKGRQDLFKKQTPQVLDTLRQVAKIESVESSNRLEGIEAPRERIKALVLNDSRPVDRSEPEIAGYRDALNLIHESAADMPYSVNIIKQIHSVIYRYMPAEGGKWKATKNDIVEKDAEGNIVRVRFTTASPVQTPQAMVDLADQYAAASNTPLAEPLVLVPLTILDFLCIHPFTDGNGRTARLLTLMLLYQAGYDVGRYISLERIFEESKESYYETLQLSSQGWHKAKHDVMPWMTYFWGVLLRAFKEFEERVGTIKVGAGTKTQQVMQAVRSRLKPFAISDIENDCPGISRDMIRVALRKMRDKGEIVSKGKGRGAKWHRVEK